MEENILSEDIAQEEILENLPGELVEELPEDGEIEIVEELPEETFEELEIIPGEDSELSADDILVEENENESLEEISEPETSSSAETDNKTGSETDTNSYEEEVLSYLETLTASSEIIQQNCKTGIENLQLISTCSFALECMIFGGVVIFCYLNRLG